MFGAKIRRILLIVAIYCGITWAVLFVFYAESLTAFLCGSKCDNPVFSVYGRMMQASTEGTEQLRINSSNELALKRSINLKYLNDTGSNHDHDESHKIRSWSTSPKSPNLRLQQIRDGNFALGKPNEHHITERKPIFKEKFVQNDMFLNKTVNNRKLYRYVHTNENLCKMNKYGKPENVFLLIMVVTAPSEIRRRVIIRKTWANVTHVLGKRIETIFLLGRARDEMNDKVASAENELFNDIAKTEFIDSYHNLTLKTVMGLTWVKSFCNDTQFVLKIDSDTVPNLVNIVEYLKASRQGAAIFEGKLFTGKTPVRDKSTEWTKKWYVSESEYPYPTYPPYINGPTYLISSFLIKPALSVSVHIPYIPIEDVYVGMLMKTIGVNATQNDRFTQLYMYVDHPNATLEFDSFCLFSNAFTVYSFDPPETMYAFWDKWNQFDQRKCPPVTSELPYDFW